MMYVCVITLIWMENGWMDWIEWMSKVDGKWLWKVDCGCGKWIVESGWWKVESGAVPDLTLVLLLVSVLLQLTLCPSCNKDSIFGSNIPGEA